MLGVTRCRLGSSNLRAAHPPARLGAVIHHVAAARVRFGPEQVHGRVLKPVLLHKGAVVKVDGASDVEGHGVGEVWVLPPLSAIPPA